MTELTTLPIEPFEVKRLGYHPNDSESTSNIDEVKEAYKVSQLEALIADNYDLDEAETIVSQALEEKLIPSYQKVFTSNGKQNALQGIVTTMHSCAVSDLLEPKTGYCPAVVHRNSYFDATFTTPSRGGETYQILFNHEVIPKIIKTIDFTQVSKKVILKALIRNVAMSGILTHQILSLEKMLIDDMFILPTSNFVNDVADARVEYLAQRILADYAILNNNGKVRIINTRKRELTISTKGDLSALFANQELESFNTTNGRIKMLNPVDVWYKSKHRMEFDGLVFDPSCGNNGKAYNLFKGFKFEAKRLIDIGLFKSYVQEVICSNDDEMFNIIWSFLAQMIQAPTRKMGTAIVLLSGKGTGKSTFVHVLGKLMNGYFMQTAENKRLLGEFNKHLESTLLFYANELTFTGNKKVVSKLKNVVTETEFTYELKGGDTFTNPNYTRVIIDSNDDSAVVQTADERRFIYPVISDVRVGDTEYFNKLYKLFATEGFYESLMHDLTNFDYAPWEHFLKTPPKNEVTAEQQIESFETVESWWYNCLDEGIIYGEYYEKQYDGRFKIANESLYNSYVKYTRFSGNRVDLNSLQFAKAFKKFVMNDGLYLDIKGKIKVKGEQKNSNVYESLSKCQEHFIKRKNLTENPFNQSEWNECAISA